MKYDYSKKSWERDARQTKIIGTRYLRYVLIAVIIVIAAIIVWSLSGSSPKQKVRKPITKTVVVKPHHIKKQPDYTTIPLTLPQQK